MINAPWWALGFYRSIEWWIPAHTRRKICLLGTDFEGEVTAYSAGMLRRPCSDVAAACRAYVAARCYGWQLLKVMSKETLDAMLHAYDEDGALVEREVTMAPAPAQAASEIKEKEDGGPLATAIVDVGVARAAPPAGPHSSPCDMPRMRAVVLEVG